MGNKKNRFTKFKKRKKNSISVLVQRPVLNLDRGTSCWRVEYTDLEGQKCSIDIGREVFRSPKDVAKMLLSAHAAMPDDPDDQVDLIKAAFASRDKNASTLVVTSRVGWHDRDGELASFVNFNRTLGPRRETLAFDSTRSVNGAFGLHAGTLRDWQNGIKEACEVSDYLVLALGIAAAGPLFGLLASKEPAIYHFHGAPVKPGADPQKKWKSSSARPLARV